MNEIKQTMERQIIRQIKAIKNRDITKIIDSQEDYHKWKRQYR